MFLSDTPREFYFNALLLQFSAADEGEHLRDNECLNKLGPLTIIDIY